MDNYTIAHKFFYDDKRQCNYKYKAVSFNDNRFYSYNTLIGLIVETKKGNKVLLYSYDTMTMTTSKHLSELRGACPLAYYSIPLAYGDLMYYLSDTKIIEKSIKKCIENVDYYSKEKLTQQKNREELEYYYNKMLWLKDNFNVSSEIKKAVSDAKRKYKKYIDIINSDEKIKELRQKQAAAAKIKAAKTRKENERIKKQIAKYSYLQQVEIAFNPYNSKVLKSFDDTSIESYNKAKELHQKVKKILAINNYAYCWIDTDSKNIRTSKNCSVTMQDAYLLLKLWKHNKLKHGYKISYYTVLAITSEYIKIGCHTIPVENAEALFTELDAIYKNRELVA